MKQFIVKFNADVAPELRKGPDNWPIECRELAEEESVPEGAWTVMTEEAYNTYINDHKAEWETYTQNCPMVQRKARQESLEKKLYWGEKTLRDIRFYLEGQPESEVDKFTPILATLRMGLLAQAQLKLTVLAQTDTLLNTQYDPSILGVDNFQGTVLQRFSSMIQQGIANG